MTRDDHLSFALEYQRRAVASDLAGDTERADALRGKAGFHFMRAGC